MGKPRRRKPTPQGDAPRDTKPRSNSASAQLPSAETIFHFLLNSYPVSGGQASDLVDGQEDFVQCWKALTLREKQDLVTVSAEELVLVQSKLQGAGGMGNFAAPSYEDVSAVQAKFVVVMEQAAHRLDAHAAQPPPGEPTNDKPPVAEFMFPDYMQHNCEMLNVLVLLKHKLSIEYAKYEIYRKMCIVMLYFAWVLTPSWWAALLVCTLIVVVLYFDTPEVAAVQHAVKRTCSAMFEDHFAYGMEWKSESFITALLLLTLASGTTWMIFVGAVALLPYFFGYLEDVVGNMADNRSFALLRRVVMVGNKLLLIVFAWSSWASLAAVCLLFFRKLSISLLQLAFACCTMGVIALRLATERIVPKGVQVVFYEWHTKPVNRALTMAVVVALCGAVFWYTYDWGFPLGGVTRIALIGVLLNVLPLSWILAVSGAVLNVLFVVLTVGSKIVQLIAETVARLRGVKRTQVDDEETSETKTVYTFHEKFEKYQEEQRRSMAEQQ